MSINDNLQMIRIAPFLLIKGHQILTILKYYKPNNKCDIWMMVIVVSEVISDFQHSQNGNADLQI